MPKETLTFFSDNFLTNVVLPAPDGAEIVINKGFVFRLFFVGELNKPGYVKLDICSIITQHSESVRASSLVLF